MYNLIKSKEIFPMLKRKKSTEQRWPGHEHSIQLLLRWEASQEGPSSAPRSSYRQDHPDTRGGETVLSIPQLSIPFKTLSIFLIPTDWQPCRVIPDLNPHKKNSLALFIYSVTKGITQALLLLWALPVSRVQCWSYRVSCIVSLHVTNQETLSFHGAKITAREKHIKICLCHANLRNRHHKQLVSSLVPKRPPCTGA